MTGHVAVAAFLSLLLTDAQLLTIKSTEENNFVSKYLYNDPLITSRTWLGMILDTQGNVIYVYTGANVKTAPTFVCQNNLNIKFGIINIIIFLQENQYPGRMAQLWFTLNGSLRP